MSTLPTTPAIPTVNLEIPLGWTVQGGFIAGVTLAEGSGFGDVGSFVTGFSPLGEGAPTGTCTLYFWVDDAGNQDEGNFPGTVYGDFAVNGVAISAGGLQAIFANSNQFLGVYVWLVAYYHGDANYPPAWSNILGLGIVFGS